MSQGFASERRHSRFDFHQLSWVFSLRLPEPAPADKPVRVEAKNLSKGGMKFFCNRRFQLFELLHVCFFEKKTGKELPSVQGKIVRLEEIDTGFGERTYGIALEFVAGTAELAPALDRAVPSSAPAK